MSKSICTLINREFAFLKFDSTKQKFCRFLLSTKSKRSKWFSSIDVFLFHFGKPFSQFVRVELKSVWSFFYSTNREQWPIVSDVEIKFNYTDSRSEFEDFSSFLFHWLKLITIWDCCHHFSAHLSFSFPTCPDWLRNTIGDFSCS